MVTAPDRDDGAAGIQTQLAPGLCRQHHHDDGKAAARAAAFLTHFHTRLNDGRNI